MKSPYVSFTTETASNNVNSKRRRNPMQINEKSSSSSTNAIFGFSFVIIAATCYIISDKNNKEYISNLELVKYMKNVIDQSELMKYINNSILKGVSEPSSDKLIPDFPDPLIYGPTPPGAIAPPLLVVDVEKTLVGSYYDVSMGWRHAKRPGVDKFLQSLSQYYEIALFSDNDTITTPEVWEAIDKEQRCHRLTCHAGELRDHMILKRLDKMNRDIRRIVLIDDNPKTCQLYPRNTLLVKPFTDLNDRSDSVLLDLIPLLQAFVHEDCPDYRETIDRLGTHQAEEAVIEYQMRITKAKEDEQKRRNQGLGGLIRQQYLNPKAQVANLSATQSNILSVSQIVGEDPSSDANITVVEKKSEAIPQIGFKPPEQPVEKKKSAFFQWLDNAVKDKEEREVLKRNKMNELYMKRMEAKRIDEERRNKTQEYQDASA